MTHHVYFARVGAYVKIGHSGNVMGRMKSIKSDHCIKPDDLDRSAPVELLRAIPDCTPNDEFQAHFLFWDHHAKGEWFHYSEQIAGEIDALDYRPDLDAYARYKRGQDMMRRIRLHERARKARAS